MSRSWNVTERGVPRKPKRPSEDCHRKFSTREAVEMAREEDSFNRSIIFRLNARVDGEAC